MQFLTILTTVADGHSCLSNSQVDDCNLMTLLKIEPLFVVTMNSNFLNTKQQLPNICKQKSGAGHFDVDLLISWHHEVAQEKRVDYFGDNAIIFNYCNKTTKR